MHIDQENISPLEAVIKITLSEEDYSEKVEKELKKVQRQTQMPGFRPGKVPFGMVKKMYRNSVLLEEVNKILADALYEYIKEKELNVLGNPLPDHEKSEDIDWDTQKEFEFSYQIGLAPKVELELSSEIEVEYHKIKVEDSIVDNYVADVAKRYGKMITPGQAEEGDVLFCTFDEMDDENTPREGGHTHKANLFSQYLKDEALKAKLTGAKPGDSFVMNIRESVGSDAESAAMVGVKKEDLDNHSPWFRFTIESISRMEPAEINQELFEKVAPGKEIATEEDFRAFLAEQIGQQYQVDADKHFKNMVMKQLLEKTALPLPEEFLKKWLLDTNKEELTEEKVEEEFDKFSDSFRWQLIENHLIQNHGVEVKPEEVNEELEGFIRAQLRQYGQDNVEQAMIDEYVKQIASNKDEVKKVYDNLFDKKLLNLFMEKLTLLEKETTFDDFVKLVTEQYKDQQPDQSDQ